MKKEMHPQFEAKPCVIALIVVLLSTVAWSGKVFGIESFRKPCPSTPTEWQAWKVLKLEELVSRRYSSGLGTAYGFLDRCRNNLEMLPKRRACLSRLEDFLHKSVKSRQKGFSLGLQIKDRDYIDTQKRLRIGQLPPELTSPKVFAMIDAAKTLDDLTPVSREIEKIGPKGTIAFPYVSRHLESVDDAATRARLFIFIPGERLDIFSQYAVLSSRPGKQAKTISVISVLKKDHDGIELEQPRVYFNDLIRVKSAAKGVVDRLEVNQRMENCYSCHKSALLSIYPDWSNFDHVSMGGRLAKVNQIINTLDNLEPAYFDPTHLGPGMGVSDLYESTCADLARKNRMTAEAYDCKACHNGTERGALNYPSGLDKQLPDTTSLAKEFVVIHESMPPRYDDIPEGARLRLFQCLVDDYYGKPGSPHKGRLTEWLAGTDCSAQD